MSLVAGLLLLAADPSVSLAQAPPAGPRPLFPQSIERLPQPLPQQPRRPSLPPPAELGPIAPSQPVPPTSPTVAPPTRATAAPLDRPVISTRTLAPPAPWQVGALPAGDRLARAPWGDLSAELAAALIAALPPAGPVTAPLALQRRVPLAAFPAEGAAIASFAGRLEHLQALGQPEAAAELAERLPLGAQGQLAREVFTARLIGGRVQEGCGMMPTLGQSDAFTAAARILCGVATDEVARAQVLAGVLRERQVPYLAEVEPFATALLAGDATALAGLKGELAPLGQAALRYFRAGGTPARLDDLAPGERALLARNAGLDARARLPLADAALADGGIAPEALRALLLAAQTDRRGPLLRAVAEAVNPAARAQAVADAWRLALPPGERLVWAAVLAVDARGLEPSLGTASASAAALPILLLAGDLERARAWAPWLRPVPTAALPGVRAAAAGPTVGPTPPRLQGATPAVAPAVPAPAEPVSLERLAPYLALLGARLPVGIAELANGLSPRARTVLEAMGRLGPSRDPILLAIDAAAADGEPARATPAARLRGLAEAERRAAPAAVAVLGLLLLGDDPLAADELAIDATLRAFMAAGLEREAAQLATAFLIADEGSPAAAPTRTP